MTNIDLPNYLFTALFLFFSSIQFFYIFYFYIRLLFHKPKKKQTNIPVSVVITAKNEAENLKNFLPKILEQKYDNFEVIVVNDASDDDTEIILAQLKKKYPNLYFTNIPKDENFTHGKKLALTIGLKAAKNDIILLTDADCFPASENWINQIAANFEDVKTKIVLGFGAYKKEKGLLNKIIRTDTVFIAINYFSFALAKTPYMGVGRNMAFRKSFFFEKGGFSKDWFILSGSDDLFVNRNATKENTKIELHQDAFTYSIAKKTFSKWFEQKQRHFSTAKFYKFLHKFLLGLENFSRISFYIFFILSIIFEKYLYLTLSIFALRLIFMSGIWFKANKLFKQKGLLLMEIIFDFIQTPLNFVLYLFSKTNKQKNLIWK